MENLSHSYQSEYLGSIFHLPSFKKIVEETIQCLNFVRQKHNADSLAFSGTSGSGIAYIASYALNMPLILVRKPAAQEPSHMFGFVEGNLDSKRYIIVDDFVSSGDTIARIICAIHSGIPNARCAAIHLYRGYNLTSFSASWADRIPMYSNRMLLNESVLISSEIEEYPFHYKGEYYPGIPIV